MSASDRIVQRVPPLPPKTEIAEPHVRFVPKSRHLARVLKLDTVCREQDDLEAPTKGKSGLRMLFASQVKVVNKFTGEGRE